MTAAAHSNRLVAICISTSRIFDNRVGQTYRLSAHGTDIQSVWLGAMFPYASGALDVVGALLVLSSTAP